MIGTGTDAIKVNPNPSHDRFVLTVNQPSTVQVITAEGKLVETFSGVDGQSFGSDYAKGVYFVQISNGTTIQVIRVIKQ